jgi:N-acetylglucosamine malate deacetylase 2
MTMRPQVLMVTAHPDDEATFAGTAYAVSARLGGAVDLLTITDGEAGSRHTALASRLYRLPLGGTTRATPLLRRVRRRELKEAARILGLRRCWLLGEPDRGYGLALRGESSGWNRRRVVARIQATVEAGAYDFVFVMLPWPSTHRDHKLSCLLALEAISRMRAPRPSVLGGSLHSRSKVVTRRWKEGFPICRVDQEFRGLDDSPSTVIEPGAPVFSLDLDSPIERGSPLTHRIVHNWVIGAHRSQGMMQLRVNGADEEQYRFFSLNSKAGLARSQRLFDALRASRG